MSMREKLNGKLEAIEDMQSQVAENRLKDYQDSKKNWKKIVAKSQETMDAVSSAFEIVNAAIINQNINKSIQELEKALEEINKERLDLSHIMENENLNAQKGYEVYREYREASRLRRLVKESIEYLTEVKNYDLENILRKLGQLNHKLNKSSNQVKYIPRIRTDLLPQEKVCPSFSERVSLYGMKEEEEE